MKAAPVLDHASSNDWIARFAEQERQRDDLDARAAAQAMHRADVERFHLRNLMALLRDQVERDVEVLDQEFPERALRFENAPPENGFVVRREHYPEARLTVTPNLGDCAIRVDYLFASSTGTEAPRSRELVLGGLNAATLHFRDDDEAPRMFRNIAELSECLLLPVLTGRPR